ncbi:3-phosphoshikimate 1-carboxyvinyltransferase [Olsenella sp. YH-ols2217]|uniref:3-phosphoshikimate 1-carboxyvinyltransferase n=1 Tax=Kribbibacterium absianum TaxID=3044210 RepID=A0ABT6ZIJ8_9ACTN|nr:MULTISPECIES: 3-phosphoshikimate 1-carboxyvinyltransferase [unclassified Olsenella]MDJ1121390.1 3-phosphoshikimate 1-carboxyvinyltransferase [Olsenella sp. YH-ols2216]MDJ1128880.1 3-phosphoshikimate 1-carboxyvinyltransferase [Olsenella sp. YH-ols2217]
MDLRITPNLLLGSVVAPPSKSQAHRALIEAALADRPSTVLCAGTNADIEATVRCLRALGASLSWDGDAWAVVPIDRRSSCASEVTLDCGESGSTLRFLLPVTPALGVTARFVGAGRLLQRPLGPLVAALEKHGAAVEQGEDAIVVTGRLQAGCFCLPGDVSSQFVSGLLFAAQLLGAPSRIAVAEPVSSKAYVDLTVRALRRFGVAVCVTRARKGEAPYLCFDVAGTGPVAPEHPVVVEGDWSAAAFWLCAGALGSSVTVEGLDLSSPQGDRQVLGALALLGCRVTRGRGQCAAAPDGSLVARSIDVDAVPDLVPPLAAVMALAPGDGRITGASRLRIKESDRLATVRAGLGALGACVREEGDDLQFSGVEGLAGGVVDACNDHRIAMMAAVAATRCSCPVTIRGAECVSKSYPGFWDDYRALGGVVEEVDR